MVNIVVHNIEYKISLFLSWWGNLLIGVSCVSVQPGPPKIVSVRALSPMSIEVKWQASFNGNSQLLEYFISARCSADESITENINASTFTHIISKLSPFASYTITMKARNEIGISLISNERVVTTMQAGRKSFVLN